MTITTITTTCLTWIRSTTIIVSFYVVCSSRMFNMNRPTTSINRRVLEIISPLYFAFCKMWIEAKKTHIGFLGMFFLDKERFDLWARFFRASKIFFFEAWFIGLSLKGLIAKHFWFDLWVLIFYRHAFFLHKLCVPFF